MCACVCVRGEEGGEEGVGGDDDGGGEEEDEKEGEEGGMEAWHNLFIGLGLCWCVDLNVWWNLKNVMVDGGWRK